MIVFMKWFAWPPHIIHDVVKGLEQLAAWIELALEWISRELL